MGVIGMEPAAPTASKLIEPNELRGPSSLSNREEDGGAGIWMIVWPACSCFPYSFSKLLLLLLILLLYSLFYMLYINMSGRQE